MVAALRRSLLVVARGLFAVGLASAPACATDDGNGRPDETGLEALRLTSVDPSIVVPGTTIVLAGDAFLDQPIGLSHLRLTGTFEGSNIDLELPATFVDFDELRVEMTPELFGQFGGDGDFTGNAAVIVDFMPDMTRHASVPIPVDLQVRSTIAPVLDDLPLGGEVYVNHPIEVHGSGFLLGGGEGTTLAVVEGCFVLAGEADCAPVGPIEVPLEPVTPFDRTRATFAFSPRITGIRPGVFEGNVSLRNVLSSGAEAKSDAFSVEYTLLPTEVFSANTSSGGGASLGQYIDIDGGGFVGGDEGLTILRFQGNYTLDDGGTALPVDLELIPEFENGELVRYVVNEDDGLGSAIDVRIQTGIFDGMVTPSITFEGDEVEGPSTPMQFQILPVRQIVWVRFQPSYVESLRAFGMRALDRQIRDRILEVLRRDYESIGIEFREEEPTDFKLFAEVELSGPDPNGMGLLGYDNSHGKDINNERLFDKIGGVNALTQQDGFAGFGGVFIDSLFAFSKHPPTGSASDVGIDLFDDIFDPFRPDTGEPISSADLSMGAIPILTSGGGCPTDDRRLQAACAIWVLGSLIGTTTSHEVGHSLGLADPLGTRFHDLGDAPDRLMDAGGARTFEERSELMGEGPARFCDDEYIYLREILPTTDPETTIERPFC